MDSNMFFIVCGHYGCGKTNFAINLAKKFRREKKQVLLVDLDVVNPYFRSSDYIDMLESLGVRVIAPAYARSNVDVPALPPEIYTAFSVKDTVVILDAGGDDAGATVLGRLAPQIIALPHYEMLCLANPYRPCTSTPETAVEILRQIETASRLKITGIVICPHLKAYTTAETILNAGEYTMKLKSLSNLPIRYTVIPQALTNTLQTQVENPFPVEVFVKTPWNS